jgi:hypothetical protein
VNAQGLSEIAQRALSLVSLPPPPFLTGMMSGLLLGILLTALVLRRSRIQAALLTVGRYAVALVPPVVACLLWGAWVGIMAAKEALH